MLLFGHDRSLEITSIISGLVGSVLSDGRGGRHRPRQGRTNFNDGGIFTNGFHTDNAEFGNQYSAQNGICQLFFPNFYNPGAVNYSPRIVKLVLCL